MSYHHPHFTVEETGTETLNKVPTSLSQSAGADQGSLAPESVNPPLLWFSHVMICMGPGGLFKIAA